MAKARLVTLTAEQFTALRLRHLDDKIGRVRQSLLSPTMPLYDPDFPDDSVDGQHALRDGSPRWFWNGKWHPYLVYVGTVGVDGIDSLLTAESPPFVTGTTNPADPVRFELTWDRHVVVYGMPTGIALGDTVFNLPAGYRPTDDVKQVCHGENAGDISFWKVQAADGAVIYEGSGSVTVS